jgi:hypothetical protein
MALVLCVVLAFMALGAGYWFARKRRQRRTMNDPLTQVFRRQEYRELDGHLQRIAVEELRRLEVKARRYVAGDVGYVVMVSVRATASAWACPTGTAWNWAASTARC